MFNKDFFRHILHNSVDFSAHNHYQRGRQPEPAQFAPIFAKAFVREAIAGTLMFNPYLKKITLKAKPLFILSLSLLRKYRVILTGYCLIIRYSLTSQAIPLSRG